MENNMDQEELISNCNVRLEALERQMTIMEAKHQQLTNLLKSHSRNQGSLILYLKRAVKALIKKFKV